MLKITNDLTPLKSMTEHLFQSCQFVHASHGQIDNAVSSLYQYRHDNTDYFATRAAHKHLLEAHLLGFMPTPVCVPHSLTAYVTKKIGRTCMLCHNIVWDANTARVEHFPDTFLPDSALLIEYDDETVGTAPSLLCRPCHSGTLTSVRYMLRSGKQEDEESAWLVCLSSLMSKNWFLKSVKTGRKNTLSHRFKIKWSQGLRLDEAYA